MPPRNRRKCAGHPDRRVHKAVDETRRRIRDRGKKDCPQRVFLQPAVDLIEAHPHLFFLPERLHDLLIRRSSH